MEFEKSLEKLKKTAVKVLKKEAKSDQSGFINKKGRFEKMTKKERAGNFEFLQKTQEKEVNLGLFLPGQEITTKYDREVAACVKSTASARYGEIGGQSSKDRRSAFESNSSTFHKSCSWQISKHDTQSSDPSALDMLADELLNPPAHTSLRTPRNSSPAPTKKSTSKHAKHIDAKNALAMEFLNLNKKNSTITEFLENPLAHDSDNLEEKNAKFAQIDANLQNIQNIQNEEMIAPSNYEEYSNNFETVSQSFKSMKRMFSPEIHSGEIHSIIQQIGEHGEQDNDSVLWQSSGWLCNADDAGLEMCGNHGEEFFAGIYDGVGVGPYDSMKSCPQIEFTKRK